MVREKLIHLQFWFCLFTMIAFIQVDFLGSTFFLFMSLQLSPTELIALLLNYYSSVLMPISQNDY